MNSSYHWQKHQAQERTENYRRQAQLHRQAKELDSEDKEESVAFGKISFAIAISVGIFVIMFLISS